MIKRRGTRAEAERYAHEDTSDVRDYRLPDGSIGSEGRTLCGHWFSMCEDDALNFSRERWRMYRPDDRPTCPACVQAAPTEWPGMLLVVRGGLGLASIVRVTGDGRWEGVYGFERLRRDVPPDGREVLHVCQDGDHFEDIGMIVRGNDLVPTHAPTTEEKP